MKRIILAALVGVLVSGPAWAETVEFKDLVLRDGNYYKKFSNVPFTGEARGKAQGKFKNGRPYGPWVGYHDNGQLNFKGTHKNQKKEGTWVEYHDNGQLLFNCTFKNGEFDGRCVSYNSDGTVSDLFTGTYKNGKKIK